MRMNGVGEKGKEKREILRGSFPKLRYGKLRRKISEPLHAGRQSWPAGQNLPGMVVKDRKTTPSRICS